MRRRTFISGLGSAAAWSLAARAQQQPMPVIGFLAVGPNGPGRWGQRFHQGLKEAGYVDGQNVAIEYRGGPPSVDRMADLATELVRRNVAVILTQSDGAALGAKRATSTIPIVFFGIGSDPVTLGLVESLNRPGGNVTGVSFDNPQLAAKRLDLLCEIVPTAATVAFLIPRRTLLSFQEWKNSLEAVASARGRRLIIVESSAEELGQAFATIVERGAGAVVVGPLFDGSADAIVSIASQHKIPISGFALRGGLMSYSRDPADEIGMVAGLVGQILKGAKPADLPVRRSAKFNFIINLKTAKQLGLDVPPYLLRFADRVIE
jgi:putative ABC transport system substrate-binding protein